MLVAEFEMCLSRRHKLVVYSPNASVIPVNTALFIITAGKHPSYVTLR